MARRVYLSDGTISEAFVENAMWDNASKRTSVSKIEIWSECFGRDPDAMRKIDSHEITAIMQQLDGWEDTGRRERLPIYGRQRIFRKVEFRSDILAG